MGEGTRRSYRFPILGAIALAAVGFLVFRSTSATSVYYLSVSEMLAQGNAARGEQVRVAGKVVPGTIQRTAETLTFTAADDTGRVRVTYGGVVPDIFKDNVEVVLEGSYGSDQVFNADTLLAKCPSKFESDPNQMAGSTTP
ncbi:MAG: cytochrome c maturation protein CcmE [Chloroflexia bacterium]|nr:cytochrome c maturation protein CcmE [Chloroflexia bacterium]